MTTPRFLQIHTLTAYPASLLNRDDAGLAKRIPFGGHSRTRISSQCLKRHWRTARDEHALAGIGLEMAVRSRRTFEHHIARPLLAEGVAEDKVHAVLEKFLGKPLFQQSAKASERKKQKDQEDEAGEHPGAEFRTEQVIVLGMPEVTFLLNGARQIAGAAADAKDAGKRAEEWIKANSNALKAMPNGAGLDGAMFGRMVTSDILARKNAAVHVAHAFTVHAEESESDYFSAVDDLVQEVGETGGGHIGETELTSGLFYGYVVVDMPQLVYNLAGKESGTAWEDAWLADGHQEDRALAARVTAHLLHLIAKVSPGAKLGSTAPYSWAQLALLEAGSRQPRTLANAFLNPVRAEGERGLAAPAAEAMAHYLAGLDGMYGAGEQRWLASSLAGAALPEATLLAFDAAVQSAVSAFGG